MNQWYTAEKWPVVAGALALEVREERNCASCPGIALCPNQLKGYRQVVVPLDRTKPAYGPVTAARPCKLQMVREADIKMRGRFETAGLGDAVAGKTFDSFDSTVKGMTSAYLEVRAYAESLNRDADPLKKHSLLMIGPVGVGKSHLLIATVRTSIERDFIPIHLPATDMALHFSSSYQKDDTREYVRDLAAAEMLAIDDMGKERANEANRVLMFQILGARYERRAPTVVTTNLTLDEIKASYGDAILSRMREAYHIVPMVGEDYRTRKVE